MPRSKVVVTMDKNWGKHSSTAHCEVMGHSTVTCGKTPQPIDMPFWMKTWVGPRNHTLDGGADPPRGRGSFGAFHPIDNAL